MNTYAATFRIYYEDTDAGGVVYYANYLKFAERARTEWLRELGFGQAELAREHGIVFMVRRCSAEFLSPARLDDLVTVETRLKERGKVRMTMQQTVLRDGKPLMTLEVELACVAANGKPVAWPKTLIEKMEHQEAGS